MNDRLKRLFAFLIIACIVMGITFFIYVIVTGDNKINKKITPTPPVELNKEEIILEPETSTGSNTSTSNSNSTNATAETGANQTTSKMKREIRTFIVDTSDGRVQGERREYKYFNNSYYFAFQGIPYAAPPVGKLRFKDPEPVEPWEGVRPAVNTGNICVQKTSLTRDNTELIGSEDCLFLNVYTPHRPDTITTLLPVMIWFHGGGFQIGSGNEDMYGPDFLIKNDVLLVTFNYRLGILGFLNLEDDEAPGNAGLKDQLKVVRWVKSNISKFGGDPKNITLFGEDAGAASIQFLTFFVYPDERDLFHKVILQSGSLANQWATTNKHLDNAESVYDELTKTLSLHYDMKKVAEVLRTNPLADLYKAADSIVSLNDYSQLKPLPFVPSRESTTKVDPKHLLVDEMPIDPFGLGKMVDIPTMIGLTNGEANTVFKYYPTLITPNTLTSLNDNPDYLLPSLSDDKTDIVFNIIKVVIKKVFFGDKVINWEYMPEFMQMVSDGLFGIGVYMTIDILKNNKNGTLYVYEFSYEGELNYDGRISKEMFDDVNGQYKEASKVTPKDPTKKNPLADINFDKVKLTGASHNDELGYLFLQNDNDITVAEDSKEYKVRDKLAKLWTNFAKHSKPTGDNVDIDWPQYTSTNLQYLSIGDEFKVMNGMLAKTHYAFWKVLFIAIYNQSPGPVIEYLQENSLSILTGDTKV